MRFIGAYIDEAELMCHYFDSEEAGLRVIVCLVVVVGVVCGMIDGGDHGFHDDIDEYCAGVVMVDAWMVNVY